MDILAASLSKIQPAQQITEQATSVGEQGANFGDFLQNAIDEVNALQQQSAGIKEKLVTGSVDDLHQVMITAEKANMALQLTVQIRNKVVEAYQEIMRMQV